MARTGSRNTGRAGTGEVTDLALVRAGREGAEAPGRRRGRPYRYDPGPMAKGPAGDKPEDAPGERDNPWAFWR